MNNNYEEVFSSRAVPSSFFTFYTKAEKPVEVVIRHLPGNIPAEDIIAALHEMDYDVITAKQMTSKRPTPERRVTHILIPPS
jgi:hypothetical protein